MTFEQLLADRGFELVQRLRDGSHRYAARPHAYLQWWVTWSPDGTAEFTWEFELGAYLKAKGFAFSVQDELSLLLFAPQERRGPAEADWLLIEMARAEQLLESIDFVRGT